MSATQQNTGLLSQAQAFPGIMTGLVSRDGLPPTKELEEVLSGWWKELLGVEHVGPDDDFFQLGGHSLIGVALFAKVKGAYGVQLELSTLFDARTVAQLARVISQNLKATHDAAKRTPPTKELEGVLSGWWKELLGVEHVAPDDDFFQLGGHSLIGVALFAKVKEAYGVELELSTLFDAKTVAQLARVINHNLQALHPSANGTPTTKELEGVLSGWWKELLKVEHVSPDDDFFQLGGHSLIGVALFAKVKEAYGVQLELSTLFDAKTVAQLARVISGNVEVSHPAPPRTWQTIKPIQPNGTRPPVFWVPGGFGTSLLAFREVSSLLGPDQPVYGFQATMPEDDHEMESVNDRASRFVEELRQFQPRGPYYLIGFCSGGFIAFEMAQQLAASGETVALLGMIECYDDRYPNTAYGKARFKIERIICRTREILGLGPAGVMRWVGGHISSAVRTAVAMAGKSRLTGPPTEADMYDRANRSIRRYNPVAYPGKAVLFIGEGTYQFRGLSQSVDPRLVWTRFSKGGSDIKSIPGDHMELLEGAIVHRLADTLKPYLPGLPTA